MRELQCPKCGSRTELVNPGISMVVCQYCNTVCYWDKAQALKTGKESILPVKDTRLWLGATGELNNASFRVVGHVRYSYGRGEWDEWYLQFDDGRIGWMSEDQRQVTWETAAAPQSELPAGENLRAGDAIVADNIQFMINEVGKATCLGGEGQLPFVVLPDEQYIYADLASIDGQHFATLEYDDDAPRLFRGTPVPHEALNLHGAERRPAVAKQADSITCGNCSGKLAMPTNREVELRVCEFCGAQIDVSQGEQLILGFNPDSLNPKFDYDIGSACKFDGTTYEVSGRALYGESDGAVTREYLLHNPDRGYVWLSEENGHFLLSQQTYKQPAKGIWHLPPTSAVDIGETTYKLYWSGYERLYYVDGSLPWVAKTGEDSRYGFLVAPPKTFTVEQEGQDYEFFEGRYLPRQEVETAFGKAPSRQKRGVHAAQPYGRRKVTSWLIWIAGLCTLLNLGLFVFSLGQNGDVVFAKDFALGDLKQEFTTEPFEIPKTNSLRVTLSTNVDNAWMDVNLALIDENNAVVGETPVATEYYHGVEGGEGWSEGNRTKSKLYAAPKPGQYRLIINAAHGTSPGYRGSVGYQIGLEIRAGAMVSRYFLFAAIVCLLFFITPLIHHFVFHKRQWSDVTDDD